MDMGEYSDQIEEKAFDIIKTFMMEHEQAFPEEGSNEYQALKLGIWSGVTAYQKVFREVMNEVERGEKP